MNAPLLRATCDSDMKENVPTNEKQLNFFRENFYIYGDFDHSIATEIVPSLVSEITRLKALNEGKVNRTGTIRFYVNSHGGWTMYVYNLLSLIEQAKAAGITVETYVFGIAFSCGSLLACAGTKGHRYIGEYAEHICHLGSTGMWVHNDIEHQREAAASKSHFDNIRSLYRKYTTIKNLDRVIRDDKLSFRGKEIIANGLADKIAFEVNEPKDSAEKLVISGLQKRRQ